MRISVILFSFFLMVSSCNSSTDNEEQVPLQGGGQKWELVRMTGSFANSETVGDDMDWQEYYVLKQNGTFIKHRERDGLLTTATGSYELITQENEKYFELTYKTGKELIASCYSIDGKEVLMYNGDMLFGTWNACDGPGLEYSLVKE